MAGPVWSQEADEESESVFELQEDEEFIGLDLSPDGEIVILTSGSYERGRATFATADTLEVFDTIELPPRLRLADPRYNAQGTKILFAGHCPETAPECAPEQQGWNIFSYDIATRDLEQLTDPLPGFGRRRPAWGLDGAVYFVGFRDFDGRSVRGVSTAIFEIEAQGTARPIFPRDSYKSRSNAIHPSVGRFVDIDIHIVDLDGITFSARYIADSRRPKDPPEGDTRVTEFANTRIYDRLGIDLEWPETHMTIFRVTPNELHILVDPDRMTGEVPNDEHLHDVTDDGQTLWAVRNNILKEYWYKLAKIEGNHADLVDVVVEPLKRQAITDFEVSGPRAIVVHSPSSGERILYSVEDWETFEVFDLKP